MSVVILLFVKNLKAVIWVAGLMGLVLMALGPGPSSLYAQSSGSATESVTDGVSAPAAPAPAVLPTAKGSGEVAIAVRSFGLGNRARPGSWMGTQIDVTDNGLKARNVIVRLRLNDLDGDQTLMQRVIVSNPGTTQRVWMYLRLPFSDDARGIINISAFEAIESGSGETLTYTPGRLLGVTRFQPQANTIVAPSVGLMGIIGPRSAGIERYAGVRDQTGTFALTQHELTESLLGLRISDLPDRWMGYAAVHTLVWTATAQDYSPSELREFQAEALREWVQRGGHLVIVLPAVAQPWMAQPTNPLAELMPRVLADRREGVNMARYRRLLTRDARATLPLSSVVYEFKADPNNQPGPFDAMPIMAGPDNEVVVVRSLHGQGAVTVIGLDVANQRLQQVNRAFQTDQFWNRILGFRGRIYGPDELRAGSQNVKTSTGETAPQYPTSARSNYSVDAFIPREINNQGSAATGILLAVLVFGAYWVIAAPLAYALLKRKGLKQHAWLSFVGATAIFTAIAWGGATLLKPGRVEGQHITFIDSVYGQTTQRVRSWVGVLLPRYGEANIRMPTMGPTGVLGLTEFRNAIGMWDPPTTSGGTFSAFPDARGYVVDTRRPDDVTVPARSTTKQLQLEWAGALGAPWGMPQPIADSSIQIGQEIRFVEQRDGPPGVRNWRIEGVVIHQLPGRLKDVIVTLNGRSTPAVVLPDVSLPVTSFQAKFDGWKPGEALVLDSLFPATPSAIGSTVSALDRNTPAAASVPGLGDDLPSGFDPLYLLTFFPMLKPPDEGVGGVVRERALLYRTATHGLDLGRWFTQPCIIITGELDMTASPGSLAGSTLPVPLTIDGVKALDFGSRLRGRTFVRWIYPLQGVPLRADPVPVGDASDANPGLAPLLEGQPSRGE